MFHFVANLKPYTLNPSGGGRPSDAFLLSVDHAEDFLALVSQVMRQNRLLVADNGNLDRIRAMADWLQQESAHVDLASDSAVQDILDRLEARVVEGNHDGYVGAVVAQQVALGPGALIGQEDLCLPALAMSGLLDRITVPAERRQRWVERAIGYAKRTMAGEFGDLQGAETFAAIHCTDFDSGVRAGEAVARAGLKSIATGVTYLLQSSAYVNRRVFEGEAISLPRALPLAYLGVMEVIAGLHVGFASVTGVRPRLHVLGLGTPVLLPLLAMFSARRGFTACDSTAPIQDAWIAPTTSLYVATPAPLKYRATRIAEFWMEGTPWGCVCPSCARYEATYPSNPLLARDAWISNGRPSLKQSDLREGSLYAQAFPLLTVGGSSEQSKAAAIARVEHNHWVLQTIEREARSICWSPRALNSWAASKVDAYVKATGGTAWAGALQESLAVCEQALERVKSYPSYNPLKGEISMRSATDSMRRRLERAQRLSSTSARVLDRAKNGLDPGLSYLALGERAHEVLDVFTQTWSLERADLVPDQLAALSGICDAFTSRQRKVPIATDEGACAWVARAEAVCLHAKAAIEHQAGMDVRGGQPLTLALRDELAMAERTYRQSLARVRQLVRQADADGLVECLAAMRLAEPALMSLVARCAAAPWVGQLGPMAPGLRVSALVRRTAMLRAATHMLIRKVRLKSTALATAATGCKQLTRSDLRPDLAFRRISSRLLGRQDIRVLGVGTSTEFVERGEKPFGKAVLKGGAGSLRLPFKSFARNGVAEGRVWLCTGRIKEDTALGLCLEVEQEGPSAHAKSVWEDHLAQMVRRSYDLYPGSIRVELELASAGQRGASHDVLCRIQNQPGVES